ncbi:MAG: hypothetical protein ABI472_25455 [Ginsengibacter sp.]
MKKFTRRSFLLSTSAATTAAFAIPSWMALPGNKKLYDGKKLHVLASACLPFRLFAM